LSRNQHQRPAGLIASTTAAARLGVKRETLYAYVSRGQLQAFSVPGHRGSWFDPLQLDALAGRARHPAEQRPALRVPSAITLVDGTRYWYRGRDPFALAASRSYEAVAEWLWHGEDVPAPPPWSVDADAVAHARRASDALPTSAAATDRLRVVIGVLGALDPLRGDLRPAGAIATARRVIANTVAALARRPRGSIAAQVASWIGVARGRDDIVAAIDDVLVIMADHELAASTLAVRVAASFGADPYAAVAAGLGAMSGARHGAASGRVETALAAVAHGVRPVVAAAPLLAEPGHVPGFGHPLYPAGDPRAAPVLALAKRGGDSTQAAGALLAAMRDQGVAAPNVDAALAAFTHAIGAAPGAGEALFSIGRLAGWLAHAIEEYADRTDFRLRAVYVGPRPETTAPSASAQRAATVPRARPSR
jgi:citrate synthase